MKKSWLIQPAIGIIQEHLQSFKDFPPRQASASLNLNEAIESALKAAGN